VRAALARRGDEAGLERVLELDARWRELTQELEQVQAELNEASRGRTGPPTPEEREALAALSERGRALSDEQRAVETERDAIWEQVPKAAQTAYSRMRIQPAVSQVVNGQCSACHVTVTSRGMQMLRTGDDLVHCENCGRILVRD